MHTLSDKASKGTIVNGVHHICMEGHLKLHLQFLKSRNKVEYSKFVGKTFGGWGAGRG